MKNIKTITQKLAAFTLIELLVVISIIAILASLALPAITGALVKGQIIQTTSNYRQLYILTQTAGLDSQQAGNTNGGFPADVGGTVALWIQGLTNGNYANTNTIYNLLTVRGTTNNSVVEIVPSSAQPSSIFIHTANLTNSGGNGSVADALPYNLKGAALVTVGGSAISITGTNYNSNNASFTTN